VSVDLLMRIGIDSLLELSQKAGISSPLPDVPSLALGTGEVSLLEMVGVYQAIANRGVLKNPVYLQRIEDRNGKVLESITPQAEGREICNPENAELMIEMLRGVVNEGTAAGLRKNYGMTADIAGKTGTTQNYTDGWFIGFTPSLVAGAWVGGDLQNVRFQTIQYGQGAYSAMPIWSDFMNRTFEDEYWGSLQNDTFEISEATRELMICEDFREKKPFQFKPFKALKERKPFKNLFRRRKNR
jgi:penicillin-binding protein 1A